MLSLGGFARSAWKYPHRLTYGGLRRPQKRHRRQFVLSAPIAPALIQHPLHMRRRHSNRPASSRTIAVAHDLGALSSRHVHLMAPPTSSSSPVDRSTSSLQSEIAPSLSAHRHSGVAARAAPRALCPLPQQRLGRRNRYLHLVTVRWDAGGQRCLFWDPLYALSALLQASPLVPLCRARGNSGGSNSGSCIQADAALLPSARE